MSNFTIRKRTASFTPKVKETSADHTTLMVEGEDGKVYILSVPSAEWPFLLEPGILLADLTLTLIGHVPDEDETSEAIH